jgi:hypothetical protein
MGMESADFPKNRGVISFGRFRFAGQPAENVAILRFQQEFVVVYLAFGKPIYLGIDETAKNKIHFAHATMPGTEHYAAAANFQLQVRRFRPSHGLRSPFEGKSP